MNYTTTTSTSTANFYVNNVYVGTTAGPVFAPPAPPPDPNREWLTKTGISVPPGIDAKETQRVRTYLERFGFSPTVPFDPTVARSTYRRLMRETHPDTGGDAAEAKAITNAWNELKLRGFVR